MCIERRVNECASIQHECKKGQERQAGKQASKVASKDQKMMSNVKEYVRTMNMIRFLMSMNILL